MPTLTAFASLSVIVIFALTRDSGLLNHGIDRPMSVPMSPRQEHTRPRQEFNLVHGGLGYRSDLNQVGDDHE